MKTEETITNFGEEQIANESVNEVQNANESAGKYRTKWQQVAIGGVAGIMMGVSGTLAATEGVSAAGIVGPADVNSGNNGEGNAVSTSTATVPVAASVNDDMSFGEAFAAARAEVGAAGVFEWHGRVYNTFYAEEWNAMSPAERDSFFAAVAGTDVPGISTADVTGSQQTAQVIDVQPEDNTDDEVRVIGVYEDNLGGSEIYVGVMEISDEKVMLVDMDHDGIFDVAFADENRDGTIDDNEILDISGANFSVANLAERSAMDGMNDTLASNDMPDYVNDADVSMC